MNLGRSYLIAAVQKYVFIAIINALKVKASRGQILSNPASSENPFFGIKDVHNIVSFSVVDTPGFGDAIDNTDSFQQINRYIDDQFERYLNDESGLNRKNIVDNRVHCCFYFISPHGHGLKPFDIEVKFSFSEKATKICAICLMV